MNIQKVLDQSGIFKWQNSEHLSIKQRFRTYIYWLIWCDYLWLRYWDLFTCFIHRYNTIILISKLSFYYGYTYNIETLVKCLSLESRVVICKHLTDLTLHYISRAFLADRLNWVLKTTMTTKTTRRRRRRRTTTTTTTATTTTTTTKAAATTNCDFIRKCQQTLDAYFYFDIKSFNYIVKITTRV